MLVDFCLPIKNEEKILEENIKRLVSYLTAQPWLFDWQIVILLNNCSDGSEKIAERLIAGNKQIKKSVIVEAGKGRALKSYFRESRADILVFMDIDLAVSLDNLPDLLNPLIKQERELVIGSRLLKKSRTSRSWWREISSRFYNYLSRLILNHNFRDLQCGFKAFKRELFVKVEPYLHDNAWFFDTELIALANYFNYNILEIPVDWQENRYDSRQSKVKVFKDAWGFLKNLLSFRKRINKIKRHHDNV